MPTYEPRDYQREAIDAGVAYLTDSTRAGRNGLIVQPTGGGKSIVIAGIVERLDGPAVVLQPSREILQQNAEKLLAYGKRPAIFSASFDRREIGQITLATIGSVVRYADAFKAVKYVLIDEAHQAVNPKGGQYLDFLDVLAGARIVGLTATPFRLASNSLGSELRFLTRTRPRIFQDVVHVTQIPYLVERGYWARTAYRDRTIVERARLKLNSTGADYTDKSVQLHFDEIGFVGALCDEVAALRADGRRHILVFTRFVSESERLAAAFGNTVAVVSAETKPDVRADVLRAFKRGDVPVVSNVGILTTGFDFPALDAVVLGRPSISLALYYQMVGRGVRPSPEKRDVAVVDMVGLTRQFGRVEEIVVKPSGPNGQQWIVASGEKQLTNVYFAQRDGVEPAAAEKAQKRRSFWAKRNRFGRGAR